MDKAVLEKEIEELSSEIEEKKVELEDVQMQLGRPAPTNNSSMRAESSGETPSAPAENGDANGASANLSEEQRMELEAKEEELLTEIVSKQMKMRALQKQLNDVVSNEAMQDASKEG